MTYSIDGVPLANPALGWRFKRQSEPWVSRGLDRPDFNASNRDGTIHVRGHVTTPNVTLVVTAPDSSVESLRRLLRLGTALTDSDLPGASLNVRIQTLGHVTITKGGGGIHELTAVYRVSPDVWWRDTGTTDYAATINTTTSSGAATMTVLQGTTGAVHDALVLVSGGGENFRIAGVNSTYVQYTNPIYGQWVRFDTTTGRCWFGLQGSGDPWTDTSNEQTGNVDTGAYPYFLELAPTSTGAPQCVATVSWTKVTMTTTVTIRARNAYDR